MLLLLELTVKRKKSVLCSDLRLLPYYLQNICSSTGVTYSQVECYDSSMKCVNTGYRSLGK